MPISRLLSLPLAALLTACDEPPAPTPREVAAQDDEVDLIDCALGEGSRFGPDCSVERDADDPDMLIVRHPGGGFRRLTVLPDASGLATSDGADEAINTLSGATLEVRVGNDRYRFPARVTGGSSADGDG